MSKNNIPMKTVTILLTKYSDMFGRCICKLSRSGYSHASISIDGDEEIFYSFNYRGFVIEKPKKRIPKKRCPESVYVRIQVPIETYTLIEEEIKGFLHNKAFYTYSRIGVVLCLLHIPHKFKNQYFCSQFVAEILSRAGAISLHKKESLYLPEHLIDGIEGLYSQTRVTYQAF